MPDKQINSLLQEDAAQAGPPNADLLLSRLENRIIEGREPDQILKILKNERLWRRLDPKDRLRWADLAQMAGEPDTALSVLDHLNRTCPENPEPWKRRLELLSILGRSQEFSRILAHARKTLGEESCRPWASLAAPGPDPPESDIDVAVEPFEQRHLRMAALTRFLDLFAGRKDCFARQWADKNTAKSGYVPVRQALGPNELEEHLSARRTYGLYLMQADGRIQTAVIDADLRKAFRGKKIDPDERKKIRREAAYLIARVKELSAEGGAYPLIEFSGGKGYHFWYFFQEPVEASTIREVLNRLIRNLAPDLSTLNLEVFPKQDRLGGKGFGNLVKLPLGVHRLTGKRSVFIDCADRSPDAQLAYLRTVKYSDAGKMIGQWMSSEKAEVVVHPRFKKWADSFPDLYRLQTCCPPLSQIIAVCLDRGNISMREEKVLYQTIAFLADGRRMLHHLFENTTDYNPHMVDYRLSRVRGTPLGCRKIHSLLGFAGEYCRFARKGDYLHPLLHIDSRQDGDAPMAEKVENLESALRNLQTAIQQVESFMK